MSSNASPNAKKVSNQHNTNSSTRQDSSSSSGEDGDETATAEGGVTTVTSPRRLANITHSPIRTSPNRAQQPKRTKGDDCAGLSNVGIRAINEDIMQRSTDLGESGDIDGDGNMNVPSLEDFFGNVAINVEPTSLGSETADDVSSPLQLLGIACQSAESTTAAATASSGITISEEVSNEDHPALPPMDIHPQEPQPPSDDIPDAAKNRFLEKNFKFTGSILIPPHASTPAGYKKPVSPAELQAISDFHGCYTYTRMHTRCNERTSRSKKVNGFNGPKKCGVEELIHYECRTAGCKCEMKTARFDSVGSNNSYILCYESMDHETGQLFEHSGHDISKEEQKKLRKPNKGGAGAIAGTAKPKYDGLSLTDAQCDFIKEFGMGQVSKNSWGPLAKEMIRRGKANDEQVEDPEAFASRIKLYVGRRKARGDPFFVSQWGKESMSGGECKDILDALKTPISKRGETPNLDGISFIQSDAFKSIWKKIVVVDHNYDGDGGNFDFILLQYGDAKLRADKAVDMYLDSKVQLEMDFFLGVCPGDHWQVGHCGFSDLNHRYWILGMVIARSENQHAAGIVLGHSLLLLAQSGGNGNRVLVDGGKALSKAVKNENAFRQLIEQVELELKRCLAHCLRRPFSRGGGYRGGKGSVHKALLDNNVQKDIVGKLVGLMIMMTFIPPHDIESYKSAIKLLINEFGDHLSQTFRNQYLTGNPADLGGLCAGRPGEVASTNGGERRGGVLKNCYRDVLQDFSVGKQNNPLFFIAAAAKDGERKQNNIDNIAVTPNRKKVHHSAYGALRTISTHQVQDSDKIISDAAKKIRNWCSDWLYCSCTVTEMNEAGAVLRKEVPLYSVIGHDNAEFEITFPSLSALFTEIKLMLLELAQFNSGAPMSMQSMSMSVCDVRAMLKDPAGCARFLTGLDRTSQKELKLRIHRRLHSNTSTPKPGENLYMFLQRKSHRDESAEAGSSFLSKSEKAWGAKKKNKRTKKKGSKHQAKLEKDKWLGEEKVEEEDLSHFLEQGEIWGDDVEIEDLVRIAQIDDLEKIIEEDDGIEGNADIIDMFQFDEKDIAELNSKEESAERVRVRRELGEGTTVSVGKECNKLCCNCEMFNRWRICRHVIWIEVVHFGKFPDKDICDAADDWSSIRQNILDLIKDTHVDVSSLVVG